MSSSNHESVVPPLGSRRAELVNLPASYAVNVDRWAVIIGVSKYKDESLNLRYADRDAEEVYRLLLSPIGGAFKPNNVLKLINNYATTANITRALRSFLQKPGRDDLVILYFACHGSPDLDRPGNVYLLTHDTDPNDIAGTALPMREIHLSLQDNLLSERIIIFADACHSASIGGGIGRRSTESNTTLVNRYLKEVSIAKGGIALLTSAEANEVSFEDVKWGGGHGVFTHYLLEGMKGKADINQNGYVTVGELFEYVRTKVQEATEYKQHPSIGTNPFDRNLPLAITFPLNSDRVSETQENQNTQSHENSQSELKKIHNFKNIPILPLATVLIAIGTVTVMLQCSINTTIPERLLSSPPPSLESSQNPEDGKLSIVELESKLNAIKIEMAAPPTFGKSKYEDEQRRNEVRGYFKDSDTKDYYYLLADGCIKVLEKYQLKQTGYIDMIEKYFNKKYISADGKVNLERVKEAILKGQNDYYSARATSFEQIIEPRSPKQTATVSPEISASLPTQVKAESEYVGVSKCRSSGQICGTTATYSFESSGGNTQLEIQASRNHCAAVKYVIMSGDTVKTTRFLNAGESAIVNLGELPAGPQKVSIGAIGRLGGCNTGAVGSWGSFVQVR